MNGIVPDITVDQLEAVLDDVKAARDYVSGCQDRCFSNARNAHLRLESARERLEWLITAPARAVGEGGRCPLTNDMFEGGP